jgi:hypothetical protein
MLGAPNVQAFQEGIGRVVLQAAFPYHQAEGMACHPGVSRLHQAGGRGTAFPWVVLQAACPYRPAVGSPCWEAYRQDPEAYRP